MVVLGFILIILTIGLLIAELFTGSGLLLLSGLISLIIGLAILFNQGTLSLNLWAVIIIYVLLAGLVAFIIWRIIRTHRHTPTTGKEDLVGKIAIVKKKLDPEGTVLYQGEYWNAVSETGKIEPGAEVFIQKVEGLKLFVIKRNPG
jgi:membrane-bound serine protease (ClpP class)